MIVQKKLTESIADSVSRRLKNMFNLDVFSKFASEKLADDFDLVWIKSNQLF